MKGAKFAALLLGLCLSHGAWAQERRFDLPAMDAVHGIPEFARQAGIQIVAPADDLGGIATPAIRGNLDVRVALKKLLVGTELEVASDNGAVITLRRHAKTTSGSRNPDFPDAHRSSNSTGAGGALLADSGEAAKGNGIEEIIVTAQKKSERLQDVPIPVTVLSTDKLADNGQVLLRDYYASVPGLSVTPTYEGSQLLSIRGITTGLGNPTVGVTIDDLPFGGSTSTTGGTAVPDIDPGDLARVEILRGPQGTLYGANSMGGLIKYVTIDPSPDGYSGHIEAGISSAVNGAEPGFNVRASANVPLSDTFAIRMSGFRRQDPGYIDSPALKLAGVNEAQADGGRLAALWRPSDVLSIKLSALYQDTHGNGLSEVDLQPGLGKLQQNTELGVGWYDSIVQAYSAVLKAKLGGVDLASVTGYTSNHNSNSLNYTSLDGLVQKLFGVSGAPLYFDKTTTNFTQELRLSAAIGKSFDWLVGGFYSHQKSPISEIVNAANPTTGQVSGLYWDFNEPTLVFEEYAAFADMTYHVTDQFDVQIGGRESQLKETDGVSTATGPFDLIAYKKPSPVVLPEINSKHNAFTYLVTPEFKVSPDLLLYARLASGYRPGGPNSDATGVPPQYNPDKTQNYELGVKSNFLDHRVSVDASVYYIDWKDIQLSLRTPQGLAYTGNGSGAKSEGVEFSVEAKPVAGLTIAAWVAYDDAVLTHAFVNPPTYGVPGNRLPNTSRYSGNFSVQQDFPLWSRATGFVGGAASYVGDRESVFRSTPVRQNFPGYTKTDLHAGVNVDSWAVNLFVNNVADVRGVIDGGLGYVTPAAFIYIQPRTVGINLGKSF